MAKDKINFFDSMAKEEKEAFKQKAYSVSNDLKRIAGIGDYSEITEIYKASDYVFMKDPLKFQNLDMKLNDSEKTDGLVVCVVTVGGKKMDFMINLSDTNGLNKGDILRIDLDKEGKESQTIWSDSFLKHVFEQSGDLAERVDVEKILAGLEINNYEDIVRETNKKDGFQIDPKKAVVGINRNSGVIGKEQDEKGIDNPEELEEEFALEEAAEKAGVPVDAIQKFCEANGIKKITGISFTKNVDILSEKIGKDLQGQDGSEVIMIRASGVNGKANTAFVIDKNGETLFRPEDTPNGEDFLLDVVREGSNGENIEDVTKAAEETNSVKIGTTNGGVSLETSEIKGENISDNLKFQLEQDIEQLMEKLINEVKAIEEQEGISNLDKARLIEERCIKTHEQGMKLQESYNVVLPGLTEKTTAIANEAVTKTETEEVKQIGKGVIGAFAAATGVKMFEEEEEEDFVPGANRGDPRPH